MKIYAWKWNFHAGKRKYCPQIFMGEISMHEVVNNPWNTWNFCSEKKNHFHARKYHFHAWNLIFMHENMKFPCHDLFARDNCNFQAYIFQNIIFLLFFRVTKLICTLLLDTFIFILLLYCQSNSIRLAHSRGTQTGSVWLCSPYWISPKHARFKRAHWLKKTEVEQFTIFLFSTRTEQHI